MEIVKVPWIDDPLTEVDLELSGLAFAREMVPYHQIDIAGGLHNPAREHSRLDQEAWENYALKMEAHSPFKRVVLYLVEDGVFKYGVAHGNHRLRAFAYLHNDDTRALKSPKAAVGAYVLSCKWSDDVEEYSRLANNREGVRQSQGHALNNAVWLVQNRKMTQKAAAERTGIPASAIGDAIAATRERARLETLGISTERLSQSHLVRIGSLRHDSHKKHVAAIANEGRLSSADVSALVTKVNRLRSEARGNELIHDEYNRTRRERVGPSNGHREDPALRLRRLFLKGLRQSEDLWLKGADGRPVKRLSDVGIAPQDRQLRAEVASRVSDLIKVMQQATRLK